MATKPKTKPELNTPLIIEAHPDNYTGLPFITLVQYRREPMLVIVDNADESNIKAYILDLCGPERVNEEAIITAASEWYDDQDANYPVSVAFSRLGMTHITSKIYRALNIEFVSRVIGPVPKYPMNTVKSIRKRRRKPIPQSIINEMPSLPDKLSN